MHEFAQFSVSKGAALLAISVALTACGDEEADTSAADGNRPPQIQGAPPASASVGLTYSFAPNASDPDGDAIVFGVDGMPTWLQFNSATGRLSGTPTSAHVGMHRGIVVWASDGKDQALLPAFNINVQSNSSAPNSAPVISGTPGSSVLAGSNYAFTPTASDANGDRLVFSVQNLPAWASFNAALGRIEGIPGLGETGRYENVTISVTDGQRVAVLPPFDIVVRVPNVNTPPSIAGVPAGFVQQGTPYAFQPDAEDVDGDELTFAINNRPQWAAFNTSNGRLAGTPSGDQTGTYPNVVISVSDGMESVSLPEFSIVVTESNAPPTITGNPSNVVLENESYLFQPSASDADNDPLTFTVINRPAWASFSPSTGRLEGTPDAADVGTYAGISINVSDGSATASLASFAITVVAVNRPPSISGSPPGTARQGVAYSFTPSASDPDGDSLTFSSVNVPAWATFSASTGRIQGTPGAADVGSYANISISVSDGEFSNSLPSFAITVPADNAGPSISGAPPSVATQGVLYSFTPSADDPDGDALSFSVTNRPGWATFNGSTGRLSGTPGSGDTGTFANISIRVTDGELTASLPSFAITVAAVNQPPAVSGTPPSSVSQDQAYSFQPSAADPDGDTLTFSVQNLPVWASFDSSTGLLQGTPTGADIGTYGGIVIQVSDGAAAASLAAFSIAVNAISTGSATLSWQAPTERNDGSPLTNLAGFRLYWGTSSGTYTQSVTVNNPGITTYLIEDLSPATYYFSATAFDAAGAESVFSNEAIKTISP